MRKKTLPKRALARLPKARVLAGRKRLAAKDAHSQDFLRLIDRLPAIIWTTDSELRITSICGGVLPLMNWEAKEALGKTLSEHFGNDTTETLLTSEWFHDLDKAFFNFDMDYRGRCLSVCVAPLKDDHSKIIGTVGVAQDVTDQRQTDESIRHLAMHDPLTGLSNYRALLKAFDTELRRSDRTGRPFSVLLLDLDELKKVNDAHGHLVGSRALCRLATILKHTCRSIDTCARYGGDEFAVLLVETDRETAGRVAARIAEKLAKDGESPSLAVSAGIAVFPADGYTVENLLAAGDRALYKDKLRHTIAVKMRGEKMSTPESNDSSESRERRRSERQFLDVPVLVRGESPGQEPFQEKTFTISVSAHGALLVLAAKVKLGQTLSLENPQTHEEMEARVARFGSPYGGLAQVGIEFSRPAPEFWHEAAPPDDSKSMRH